MTVMESGGASPFPVAPRTSTPSGSNLNPNARKKVKICVYCGSAPGKDPAHVEAARRLGTIMAENDISLGAFADSCDWLMSCHTHHTYESCSMLML